MKRLFPYLTPSNLKHLFAPKSVEPGSRLGDEGNPSPSASADEINGPLKIDPRIVRPESFKSVGDLLREATGLPFFMICDLQGQVVWEDSERAFDVKAVEKDILTHLREGKGSDLGEFKKLISYPKDVEGEPRDGVIRFGVVVPLVFEGERIGALVGCHDRETMMTHPMRRSFSRAGRVLVEIIEEQSRRHQAEAEAEARQEVQSFLSRGYGDAFLGMACKKLAKITGSEWVFVLSMEGPDDRKARVVSAVFEGASVAPFPYDIAESPLRGLKDASLVFVGTGCVDSFSSDTKIQEEKISGFAAIGLPGLKDKIAGALVAMSRRPLENEGKVSVALETMAPKVAAVLQSADRLREAEETGQRWQKRFLQMVNSDGFGILMTRPDGSIDSTNDYLTRWLQYTPKDLQQLTRRDIIVAGVDDEEARWRQECVSGDRSGYERKVSVRRNDQKLIEAQLSVTSIPGNKEGEVMFIESLVDIAREEELNGRLREVETEWHRAVAERGLLLRSSPLPLAKLDASGIILEVNGAWCDLFEGELPGFLGASIDSLCVRDNHGFLDSIKAESGNGGSQAVGVFEFNKSSGQTFRAALWSGRVGTDDQSAEPPEVFVALIDQSDREAGQRVKRDAAEITAALQRLPGQALGWLDATGFFLRTSSAMERLLARDLAALRSVALPQLFTGEERAKLIEQMELLRDGSSRAYSWVSGAVDGVESPHRLEWGLVALPDHQDSNNGEGEKFLLSCRDRSAEQNARSNAGISEEQANALADGAPCGVLVVDQTGSILSANPVCSEWMGQSSEKLKGSLIEGWMASPDFENLTKKLSTNEGGKRFSMEAGLMTLQGDKLSVRITGRQVRRISAAAVDSRQWILFLEDLTPIRDKTEALATLGKELNRLRLKADALQAIHNVGVLIVGMNEVVLEANEFFQSSLGTEAVGVELSECFDLADEEEAFHEAVADCLTGKREVVEVPVSLKKSGSRGHGGTLTLHGVRHPDGDVTYLVGLYQDTSELTTLRRQWDLVDTPYRELIEQADVGIISLDAGGKITRVNHTIAEWSGLKPSEMTGQELSGRLLSDDENKAGSILEAAAFSGEFEWVVSGEKALPVRIESRRFGEADSLDRWYLLLVRSLAREVSLDSEIRGWKTRYESAFTRNDLAMALCDERGQLLDVNPALVALSGLSRERLLMRSWKDMMGGEVWNPPVSGDDIPPMEVPVVFSENREMAGRLFLQPCGEAPSGGRSFLAILVDRSVESALIKENRSLQTRLEAVLSNPAVGVAVLDASGVVNRANEKFAQTWGRDNNSVVGLELDARMPEDTSAEWNAFWEEMHANQRSRFQVEWIMEKEGGETADAEETSLQSLRLTPVLLDPDKDDSFAIVFLEDVSELAHTRRELDQVRTDLGSTRDGLSEAKREIAGLNNNKSQLLTQCSTLEASLRELTTDRDGLRESKSNLEAEQGKLISERDQLQADLETARGEGDRLSGELEQKETKLRELEAVLAALREEKARLDESLQAKEQELIAKEQERSTLKSERDSLNQTRLDNEKAIQEKGKEKEDLVTQIEDVNNRLEETEHQRDSLLNDTITSSPAAMAIADEAGTVRQVNQAFAELLESTPDELSGKNLQDCFRGRLEEEHQLAIKNVLEGRASTFQVEIGVVMADQAYRWLLIIGSRAPDHAGNGAQVFMTAEDKSSFYAMENDKAASETRFLAIAETGSVGLLLTDERGTIFFANPAASRMLANEGEDLNGRTLNETAHADDPREDLELDQRMVRGEIDDYTVEKWLQSGDAPSRWLRMSVRAVRMEEGGFWYAVRTLEDLSELRRTSEELEKTKARWNRIFDTADVAIILMGRRGEVLEKNTGFQRILGPRSEAEVAKVLSRMKGADADTFSLQFGRLVSGELPHFEMEDDVAGADKETVRIRARVTAMMKPDGSFELAVAVVEKVELESKSITPAPPPEQSLSFPAPSATKPTPTSLDPEASRKQALKESVKISESQRINVEALKKIQAPGKKSPGPKPKMKAEVQKKNGWIVADSNGTVLVLSPRAGDYLKTSPALSLRKPLAEVIRVKKQAQWHPPQSVTDSEITNLAVMESEIWNPDNEVSKVVNASCTLMGSQGEFLGTIIILIPSVDFSDSTDSRYHNVARSFLQTATKIQAWSEKELPDLLLNGDIMNSVDFAKEAEKVAKQIDGLL